jgi:hypothetical protein
MTPMPAEATIFLLPAGKPHIAPTTAFAIRKMPTGLPLWRHCEICSARVALSRFSGAEPIDCRWDRPGATVVTRGVR